MAIFRFLSIIHPTKNNRYGSLARCINYITDKEKTLGGRYNDSLNCTLDNALKDMIETKEFYGKTSDNKRDRLAYHCELSWSSEEKISYEDALQITKEFCETYLPGYEAVLATHTDKAHTHVHIIFNSVNQQTGLKYQCPDGEVSKIIGPLVDSICKKHGFMTLFESSGVKWEEVEEERKKKKRKKPISQTSSSGKTHRRNNYYNDKKTEFKNSDMVAADFDEAIIETKTIQEFYDYIQNTGYKITRRGFSKKRNEEYFAVSGRGLSKAIRNYSLGSEYSIQNIEKRIEMKNKPLPIIPIEVNVRYIIPFMYWRKSKRQLTDFEKRQYYRLYKSGIKPKDYYPNYQEIKKALKKIQDISNQIDLIKDNNLTDSDAIKGYYNSIVDEVNIIKEEKKQLYVNRKPYKHMLDTYNKLKKNEDKYYQYVSGATIYKKEYDEYIKCKDTLKKLGFSENDVMKFQETLKYKLKDINKRLKESQNKLSLISDIKDSYYIEDPEYSQDKFNKIPTSYDSNKNALEKSRENKER